MSAVPGRRPTRPPGRLVIILRLIRIEGRIHRRNGDDATTSKPTGDMPRILPAMRLGPDGRDTHNAYGRGGRSRPRLGMTADEFPATNWSDRAAFLNRPSPLRVSGTSGKVRQALATLPAVPPSPAKTSPSRSAALPPRTTATMSWG